MKNPTDTDAYKQLETLSNSLINHEQLDAEFDDFYLNFSRNKIDQQVLDALIRLAEEMNLSEEIQNMFSGKKINITENRAVLHPALRDFSSKEIIVDGENIVPWIQKELAHIEKFSEEVLSGTLKGYTGKKITDVVNIGIGGSDLGPKMAYQALTPYHNQLNVHYVSNVDANDITYTLQKLNPETTLFIIVSKTFTTIETMTNAYSAQNWLTNHLGSKDAIAKHFVAVSTNLAGAKEFGIEEANIFRFWDWVGGRYSLWSTVGLSLALGVGYKHFKPLLQGAHEMDIHFRTAKFRQNLPVLLALIGIWNRNFLNINNQAVIAYNELLNLFVPFLQQLDMESNGKSVDRNGEKTNYATGPIIWGGAGTNVQHSFFQHIHQGTDKTCLDFIGVARDKHPNQKHHRTLLSNMLAQAKSLYEGNKNDTSFHEGKEQLKNWRMFEGNTFSNVLIIKELSPQNLGKLIALYEHKVFVQGVIWNIFSFDQWGVELGKINAKKIEQAMESDSVETDPVTKLLIKKIQE